MGPRVKERKEGILMEGQSSMGCHIQERWGRHLQGQMREAAWFRGPKFSYASECGHTKVAV